MAYSNNPILDSFRKTSFWHIRNTSNEKAGVKTEETPRFVRRVVERGITTSWDHQGRIWRHAFFNKLNLDPKADSITHPIFVIESLLNPKANREKLVQTMFEKFQVPELFIEKTPVLSLRAVGATTGVVIHSGCDATEVVPVVDGSCCVHCAVQEPTGGRQFTELLQRLLTDQGRLTAEDHQHGGAATAVRKTT
jgi:actin-related protein